MSRTFKAGEVYSFKTFPFYKFGDLDTQRYACLKILSPKNSASESKDSLITYVVLKNIFSTPPSLNEIRDSGPLIRNRFAFGQLTRFQTISENSPKNYATNSARLDWEPDLLEFTLVGTLPLSVDEIILNEKNSSYSVWSFASLDAEGEWRWENDQDKLLAEHALQKEESERLKQAKKERFEKRLSKLTWEKLLEENHFERWVESPPFPPRKFKDVLSKRIKLSIFELQSLGEKYPRAKVRKILKSLVNDITSLDQKFDYVIETEEREDIYDVFDDITYLAKQRILMEEIPDWHHSDW